MKTVKYVLLALLVASTGLSAMEPIQQNERALALHESLEDQGLTLPNGLAQNIVEYVEAEEELKRAVERRKEIRKEHRERELWGSLFAVESSIPLFAVAGVSALCQKDEKARILSLSAAALFSTGFVSCCSRNPRNSIKGDVAFGLGTGLFASYILPVLSIPLYPFYALLGKKRTANFGAKAVSASLVPFFGSGLLQSSDSKSALLNGVMLAASGMLTYSGIQDIIKYKNSDYTSFSKFVVNNGKNLNEQDA